MKKLSLIMLSILATPSFATEEESIPKENLSERIEQRLKYENEADKNPFSLTTRE